MNDQRKDKNQNLKDTVTEVKAMAVLEPISGNGKVPNEVAMTRWNENAYPLVDRRWQLDSVSTAGYARKQVQTDHSLQCPSAAVLVE